MPNVRAGESQKSYVSRAIKTMIEEGMSPKHAAGKAHGMWKSRRKKSARKMSESIMSMCGMILIGIAVAAPSGLLAFGPFESNGTNNSGTPGANTVGLVELDTTDVDTRYLTTGTAQSISAGKTFNSSFVVGDAASDTMTVTAYSIFNASITVNQGVFVSSPSTFSDTTTHSKGVAGSTFAFTGAGTVGGTLGVTDTITASAGVGATTATLSNTGATALDVAGGAQFGTGDVALIGTDGKINGPLSSTIIDDLSGANLTGITSSGLASGSVGTTQIIDSTVALVDLNTVDVDTRYLTTGTVQTISSEGLRPGMSRSRADVFLCQDFLCGGKHRRGFDSYRDANLQREYFIDRDYYGNGNWDTHHKRSIKFPKSELC